MIEQAANGRPRIGILGAGPAGTGAAFRLAQQNQAHVAVFECRDRVGGNAGSFELDGVWCDYGSHRLHPVVEERVMDDLKSLLGDDLLWCVRRGRILLGNRWIHFPLKPINLLTRLPKSFIASMMLDTLGKAMPRRPSTNESFATVLRRGLGKTMCESFYFPYARKLWGVEPEQLAVTCAQRRVSGNSVSKIIRKIMGQIPGLKSKTAGRFYYPKRGYGQITERLFAGAVANGAKFNFNARVTGVNHDASGVTRIRYEKDGRRHEHELDAMWSTLPVTMLIKMFDPPPPADVLQAMDHIRYRGMILIYLVLEQQKFSEADAYYFPEERIPITRMSEPKTFSGAQEPQNRTVLCAELPVDADGPEWALSDEQLGEQLMEWLASVGLRVTAPVLQVVTRRLRYAYPIYELQYERHFSKMDDWLEGIPNLLNFGRQGLFAHDNTHHALTMAYAASDCLRKNGEFDRQHWATLRKQFETHVVED